MTKIGFIVVAYNAAQSLDALLGDLLSQTIAPEQLESAAVAARLHGRHRADHASLCRTRTV